MKIFVGCYGRGSRRLILKWYLTKTPLQLAEIVTTTPKWNGWRHKDLLKLSHIKSAEPGLLFVFFFFHYWFAFWSKMLNTVHIFLLYINLLVLKWKLYLWLLYKKVFFNVNYRPILSITCFEFLNNIFSLQVKMLYFFTLWKDSMPWKRNSRKYLKLKMYWNI